MITSLYYKSENLSRAVVLVFILINFIPALTLYSFMPQNVLFVTCFLLYWVFLLIFIRIIPTIYLPKVDSVLSEKLIFIATIFFSLFIIFLSGRYAGFRLNFNLLNVYELRDEIRNIELPLIFTYLFSAAKVVIPILSIYFYSIKKYGIAIGLFIIQFLSFSVDGSKSTLFSIVLTYIIYFFVKRIKISTFSIIIFISSVFSFLEVIVMRTNFLVNFFIRRAMFLPNLLNIYYFDFFGQNPKDFFRQGLLGRIGIDSPYNMSIPNLIGLHYFNAETMLANNGLFSDAYYNLGIGGIVIMPLLIILTLKVLDGCTVGIEFKILIGAVITVAYTFISSSFFTVLLTHGLLLTGVVLWLIPKNRKEKL
ncbi:O-antigen polymerase [Enterococcus saigonensis]